MDKHTQELADQFHLLPQHAQNIIELLDDGSTIPFIARYRKEMHNNTDDQVLRAFSERLEALRKIDARREEIISSLTALEKLTDELSESLEKAKTLSELEDIYRPYRPKRRTRASIAREKGLEPLAMTLRLQQKGDLQTLLVKFISSEKGVESAEDALAGACDILAEDLADDASIRGRAKVLIRQTAVLRTKAAQEGESVYTQYYDFSAPLRQVHDHQVLAINRGEKEGWLKAKIELDDLQAEHLITNHLLLPGGNYADILTRMAADAWERLLFPSLEREIRSELTDKASTQAIATFADNLRPLVMQPPLKNRVVLGFDPAYRTGCKLAVVEETGKVLATGVIYPTPPHNKKEEAAKTLEKLIRQYGITAIAIGNGTASKESEIFVAELLKSFPEVGYMMVSEAGASVYSASPLAAEEFPDYDVSLRSAVSIARRLQDPLAELVKIDPKAIGVGQYQHDMPPSELDQALTGVVEDCVNAVGVNVNTASPSLLTYVSGLNKTTATNIVKYREENGAFASRTAIRKVPKIGPKAYEQCAGFLRVPEAKNVLDHTGVHPESYEAAQKLLEVCGYTLADVKNGKVEGLKAKADALGLKKLAAMIGAGELTLGDIIGELEKPGRDPRDALPPPMLRTDILSMEDLKPGTEIDGTVRNVTDFGAFVDIGVHRDGLVHISQLSDRFVRRPADIVKVGDVVHVTVLSADTKTGRIALSMRKNPTE